jgi:hypothetical protein
MSVLNILDASNKILETYLPSGSANNYCDNPMTENLVADGFGITELGKLVMEIAPVTIASGVKITQPAGGSVIIGGPTTFNNQIWNFSLTFLPGGTALGNVTIVVDFGGGNERVVYGPFSAAAFNALTSTENINITFVVPGGALQAFLELKDAGATAATGARINVIDGLCCLIQNTA